MNILSFCPTHDSSVCFLKDGKVQFYCKEERITRIKRDSDPFKSLDIFFSLHKDQIDHVVYAMPSDFQSEVKGFFHRVINKKIKFNKPFEIFSHHLCHAMLAFVNSCFEESLVVVIDRDGSGVLINDNLVARESESVFVFKKDVGYKEIHKSFWHQNSRRDKIKQCLESMYPNCCIEINNQYSIVKVYEAATTLIGQHPLENGKTMGLSSYGNEDKITPLFYDHIPLSHKFMLINKFNMDGVVCFFGEEELITKDLSAQNYHYYADKAKQVQIETQKQALNLIKKYVEKTGIKNVCLVGGYALNIVANNFYLKNLPDVNFYFEPTADDTGVSIGGAMTQYFHQTNKMAEPLKDNFFHYYDNSEKIEFGEKSSVEEVVNLLIEGKSVAIFENNPEVGPRALGHRSILFDARIANSKEIINRIKKREWYRPFAGVVLESEFEKYFHTLGVKKSQYMTINFDAKEETKKLVPGIIHVDGTCRIQTVNEGFLFELLQKFYEKTNCPMILNTSFNLAGQPLVQTKQDAIQTLNDSLLDAVFFVDEQILVKK